MKQSFPVEVDGVTLTLVDLLEKMKQVVSNTAEYMEKK